MTLFLLTAATILLALLLISLVRVVRGPTAPDRMLAAQLMGTAGVGLFLVLGHSLDLPGLADGAVIIALLAAFSAIAFVRRGWPLRPDRTEDGS